MDLIVVSFIVAIAVFFTVRGFIKIYKGEKSCDCGGCKNECSSHLKDDSKQDFPISD